MNDLSLDSGIFIRSMATHGALGGLCRAAGDAVDVISAAGRELILLETVGVGQDEVDVMRVAHTTVVVSVPGLGDEIQALKAGVLEIADIHVVNKGDREGSDRTVAELTAMLAMTKIRSEWMPPVVRCASTREEGALDLLEHIRRHWTHLNDTGGRYEREKQIAEARVLQIAQAKVAQTLTRPIEENAFALRSDIARVARRDLTPYSCARALLMHASEAERAATHT
jgi:LAO/AO transport system kinase